MTFSPDRITDPLSRECDSVIIAATEGTSCVTLCWCPNSQPKLVSQSALIKAFCVSIRLCSLRPDGAGRHGDHRAPDDGDGEGGLPDDDGLRRAHDLPRGHGPDAAGGGLQVRLLVRQGGSAQDVTVCFSWQCISARCREYSVSLWCRGEAHRLSLCVVFGSVWMLLCTLQGVMCRSWAIHHGIHAVRL